MTEEQKNEMWQFERKNGLKADYNRRIKKIKDELESKLRGVDNIIAASYSHEIDRVMELVLIPLNYSSYHKIVEKKLKRGVSQRMWWDAKWFIYYIGYCPTYNLSAAHKDDGLLMCRNDIGIKKIEVCGDDVDDFEITFSMGCYDDVTFKQSHLINPKKFKLIKDVIKSVEVGK